MEHFVRRLVFGRASVVAIAPMSYAEEVNLLAVFALAVVDEFSAHIGGEARRFCSYGVFSVSFAVVEG